MNFSQKKITINENKSWSYKSFLRKNATINNLKLHTIIYPNTNNIIAKNSFCDLSFRIKLKMLTGKGKLLICKISCESRLSRPYTQDIVEKCYNFDIRELHFFKSGENFMQRKLNLSASVTSYTKIEVYEEN